MEPVAEGTVLHSLSLKESSFTSFVHMLFLQPLEALSLFSVSTQCCSREGGLPFPSTFPSSRPKACHKRQINKIKAYIYIFKYKFYTGGETSKVNEDPKTQLNLRFFHARFDEEWAFMGKCDK